MNAPKCDIFGNDDVTIAKRTSFRPQLRVVHACPLHGRFSTSCPLYHVFQNIVLQLCFPMNFGYGPFLYLILVNLNVLSMLLCVLYGAILFLHCSLLPPYFLIFDSHEICNERFFDVMLLRSIEGQ